MTMQRIMPNMTNWANSIDTALCVETHHIDNDTLGCVWLLVYLLCVRHIVYCFDFFQDVIFNIEIQLQPASSIVKSPLQLYIDISERIIRHIGLYPQITLKYGFLVHPYVFIYFFQTNRYHMTDTSFSAK